MNRNETVSFLSSPQEIVCRRWWTLVVLSASLLVIGLDNTILNVALPTLERDLGASSLPAAVDRRRLHARLRRPAAHRRRARRPLRPQARAHASASPSSASAPVFPRWPPRPTMLIATRALMGVGGAFIMPSTLSIITAVFPADERAEGDRRLGRRLRPRHRHRPGRRRLADRARELELPIFLVNLPFVAAALLAGRFARPRVQGPRRPAARPARLRPLDRRPDHARVGDHRGAVDAAGPTRPSSPRSPSPPSSSAPSLAWELRAREPMLDVRLFRNPRFSGAERRDHAGVLRAVRVDLLPHPVPAGRARLLARSRPALRVLPVARRPDPRRPALGEARRAARHEGRRGRRAHARRGRPVDR